MEAVPQDTSLGDLVPIIYIVTTHKKKNTHIFHPQKNSNGTKSARNFNRKCNK